MAEVTQSPTPYKRKGLSSQREVLNLFLALGPIDPVVLSLVRGCDITLTVTVNDRERCRKTGTLVSFSMTFCYSFPSRAQISRFLLVYMSLKNLKSKKKQKTS